jgi:hypothetical protein
MAKVKAASAKKKVAPAKKGPARKAPARKAPARKAPARKAPARKAPARKAPARKAPARKAPARKMGPRADLGAPVDGFFAKQPTALRAVLDALRAMVEAAAPDASASLKWGMPFYAIDGRTVCALGGHTAHVNLILPGPPGTYADPAGRLTGTGTTGKHLRLTSVDDLPRAEVKRWLVTAVDRARRGL